MAFDVTRRYRIRPGWGRVAVAALVALTGNMLVGGGVPVEAHHSIGDDPAAYGEPHAGWVAPLRAPGRLAPATGALLGVHPEDKPGRPITPENQKIIGTEEYLGRRLDIDNSYVKDFEEIANDYEAGNPDKRGLSNLVFWDVEQGRIPLVGWACAGKGGVDGSRKITDGEYDEVIRKTAQAFKDFGHEVFMRYCWEMDGDKRKEEVGTPEEFVAAWIYIYNMFKAEGVSNVVWVWCGNANSFKYDTARGKRAWDYYPGDEYVDWVSADGYNWGAAKRGGDRWRGMVEIFDEFMVWARSTGAPAAAVADKDFPAEGFPRKHQVKPIMIGEYGAIEDPDDHMRKTQWMIEAHDTVNGNKPRTPQCPHCGIYSDIAAIVYFDINADAPNQNGDWRIFSSEESKQAYKQSAADDPWFDQIQTIGWAPAANRPGAPPATTTTTTTLPDGDPGTTTTTVRHQPAGTRSGYWMVSSDGRVYNFGEAPHAGNASVQVPAVDLEPTSSGGGYWIVDGDGHVFANGDARWMGNADPAKLGVGEKVTSLSSTPSGRGYWIFTDKGRVLIFGDAAFFGDMAATRLNGAVLDSIPTASGKGYYMVASDGGIFSFGDARFHGSMGDKKLNAPVQSLVPDGDGLGYWLVASDGGIFAFDAPFRGSMGSVKLNKPITGMVRFGNGYLMVGEDGGVFNFSDKPFHGSLGNSPPTRPIVSVAALAY
jgi:glycosyl hydrolase family 26